MRYFFHIGYHGFNYRGWQKSPQTKGNTVQYIIEDNLSKILKTDISIIGCGRTDAKVNAGQFFFHVDIDREWDFDLLFRLNKNLPDDIAVFDVIPMQGTPHARFDAIERTYNYFIHTYKDPYLSTTSSRYLEKDLRVDKMIKAASILSKYDDYSVFSKNIPEGKSTICKVTSAGLYVDKSGDSLKLEITSNRFLNGMIRIIVHRLLMIGRGELTVDEFEGFLKLKKKPPINRVAHPQGLYLTKVKYPFLDLPLRSEFLKQMIT